MASEMLQLMRFFCDIYTYLPSYLNKKVISRRNILKFLIGNKLIKKNHAVLQHNKTILFLLGYNKTETERFLEEMAAAGIPSVRSYVQDQCFVALTRNTASFSLSYLHLADSLLRLFCPSMRYYFIFFSITILFGRLD